MNKRKTEEKSSIKNAFEDMLETYKLKQKFSESTLIASWERLLGKTIANRTSRLFIKEKVLFVELTSAALKHELNSSKERVLKILEEEFGSPVIDDVVFL